MEKYGACLYTLDDSGYPARLAEIYDPPLALFARGALAERDQYCVAIVGTRRPSPYGARMAAQLAGGLASRGVTVVSGLAAGIDAAAHQGALEAGGRTVAVLGCGVDIVYPPENTALMQRIALEGSVLSPFPMGVKPSRGHFPYRNRIISGLCLGTLVIEAPPGSGALITAKTAAEQGPRGLRTAGSSGPAQQHGAARAAARGREIGRDHRGTSWSSSSCPPWARQPAQPAQETTPENLELDLSGETRAARAKSGRIARRSANAAAAKPLGKRRRTCWRCWRRTARSWTKSRWPAASRVSEALSTLTLLELKGAVRQFSGKRFAPR